MLILITAQSIIEMLRKFIRGKKKKELEKYSLTENVQIINYTSRKLTKKVSEDLPVSHYSENKFPM